MELNELLNRWTPCFNLPIKLEPFSPLPKIQQLFNNTIKLFQSALLFLKRYVGSKYWNLSEGYHFNFEKKISKAELEKNKHYAFANAANSNGNTSYLNDLGYKLIIPSTFDQMDTHGFEIRQNCFFHPEFATKIQLYEKENNLIISIGALGSHLSEIQNKEQQEKLKNYKINDTILNFIGFSPERYFVAEKFIEAFLNTDEVKNKNLTLTGNCIGGSIASYIGLQKQLPTVCFNPIPLGAGLQQAIGNERLNESDKYLTSISITWDWASDPILISKIDRILSFLGIRTPGNFGKRYYIPTLFKGDVFTSHTRVVSSINNHLRS